MSGVRRIVSLVPAGTDIVAALGLWELIVGVSHECDVPIAGPLVSRVTSTRIDGSADPGDVDVAVASTTAQGLPLFELATDRIRALAPDLIITQGVCDVCAVSERDVRAIARSIKPTPRLLPLSATRFDDVLGDISDVAAALGADEEGRELLAGIRHRLRRIHERLKSTRAPRPRVAVIEWSDPLYVAGHWVPDMVRRAGGQDVLAVPGAHSRRIDVAEIRSAEPDIVLVAPCGYDVERSATEGLRLLASPGWEWAHGLPVWSMDGNALTSRPGPRLCEGIETMVRIFNPTIFSPIVPRHARPLTSH